MNLIKYQGLSSADFLIVSLSFLLFVLRAECSFFFFGKPKSLKSHFKLCIPTSLMLQIWFKSISFLSGGGLQFLETWWVFGSWCWRSLQQIIWFSAGNCPLLPGKQLVSIIKQIVMKSCSIDSRIFETMIGSCIYLCKYMRVLDNDQVWVFHETYSIELFFVVPCLLWSISWLEYSS